MFAEGRHLIIAALLSLEEGEADYYIDRMVRAVISIFDQDINEDRDVLPHRTVSFVHGNSGGSKLHVALVAATELLSQAKSAGILIGWLGPSVSSSCEVTQGLIQGLNQPQLR